MKKSIKAVVLAAVVISTLGVGRLANAAIMFDLRCVAASGPGVVRVNDKSVLVTDVGGQLSFELWAVVTGVDANPLNDGFQTVRGYVTAPTGGGPSGNLAQGGLAPPFDGSGSIPGSNTDINGDGFLDLGTIASSASTSIAPRSNSMTLGTIGGSSFKFYAFSMPITSKGNSGNATIDFVRVGTLTTIAWQEDGVGKNSSTGTILLGAPVGIVVPEPASLGMLALGSLALLARRRK